MKDIIFYYPEGHSAHSEIGHPERPERVEVIKQAFQAVGLWDEDRILYPIEIPKDLLTRIHTEGYLKWLENICSKGQHIDGDTYTTPATWDLAHKTVGGSLAVAKTVWSRNAKRGFALTRPPGHHATPSLGMGFCIFNNIALAAEYLLSYQDAKRLAIVDFDLHHGNGTQEIFWKRADVLYISTHQSPLYPGTGSLSETGSGDGEGKNVNIPLPPGTGDEAFRAVLHELILPLLDRYNPEMILVSYGFDPHWRDPLGNLQLSAAVYGDLIAGLTNWADDRCDGKIALFLEGGYDLEAAAACSLSVAFNLLGKTWEDSIGSSPHPEGRSWRPVLKSAKDIWQV
jgi:acetoin utilization deacetylase AcuC-like enzyme